MNTPIQISKSFIYFKRFFLVEAGSGHIGALRQQIPNFSTVGRCGIEFSILNRLLNEGIAV